jgi:hypothetical protein
MALLGLMMACNKPETSNQGIQDGEECIVSFHPVGEISTSESPLTKVTLTDDIYCVQVYKGSDSFAFGYFDNLESMKLALKKGSSYRIIVSMVKDAKNLLSERFRLTQNSLKCYGYNSEDIFVFTFGYYYSNHYYQGSASDRNSSYYYPINIYNFAFKSCFYYYSTSSATTLSENSSTDSVSYLKLPNIEKANINGQKYPTCTDWFYGEVNDYSPTGDYETLDINFKRVGFKLKYELSGVTDGEVTVTIKNGTRTFIENTTNTEQYVSETQFIAFYDTKSAWQYAADYSENMEVGVVWLRGIGVTQDLGKKTIQVKRNCLNNIKIALGSDDRNGTMNMSMESEGSMGSANTDIPVQ